MRRKWAVASEVAETMTSKCEEIRMEVSSSGGSSSSGSSGGGVTKSL